jgi:hypothetical protein
MKVTVHYTDGTSDWEIYYDLQDAIHYAKAESRWSETDHCILDSGMKFRAGEWSQ